MSAKVGIRDVARRAGVSTATVSHVLNGTRTVRDETRRRVLAVVRELGYLPNGIARSLTTRRTMTVGVLISNISNIFFAEVIRGIESVLTPAGYSYILCNTDGDAAREQHYLDLLLAKRVDGLIAAPAAAPWPQLRYFRELGLPVVYIDRTFPSLGGPAITLDNEGGAYAGVRHLIEDGHRRLAILAGLLEMPSMAARLAGYRRALRESGIADHPACVVPSAHSIEAAVQAALSLLEQPRRPAAIFCANNLLAIGALQALRRLRLRCPDDVALLAFDDHPWAVVAAPPLSVVRQPSGEMGQLAARTLLERLGATPATMAEDGTIVLPTTLVIRQSCAPHATAEHIAPVAPPPFGATTSPPPLWSGAERALGGPAARG